MKIEGPRTPPQKPPQPPPGKLEDLWHDVVSGELLEASLRLTPAKLNSAIEASRDVGKAVGKAWSGLRDTVRDVLHLPVVENVVPTETREKLTEVLLTTASLVGYSVAGVQALAGAAKLHKGIAEHSTMMKVEGALDVATAAAIITTIAGAGPAPLVLVPLAAVLGIARGSMNAVSGYRHADGRKEVQGVLDSLRSAGTACALLSGAHTAISVAGHVLGPIAGAVQLARGYVDLSRGLKAADKGQQLAGLCDIGSAVGLTLAMTGVGTIPGVALTVGSVGLRLGCQLNDKLEKKMEGVLEKWEPGLQKAVNRVQKVVDPVLDFTRPLFDKITGWHHGDQSGEPPRNDA